MEGFVLAKNTSMLRLATRIGFSISPDPDDQSVRICRLRLADCNGVLALFDDSRSNLSP